MLSPTLGLLGILWTSSTIGVHAERIRGLDEAQREAFLRELKASLESGGHRVVIDGRPPSLVAGSAVAGLAQNLQVDELLIFSAFAGPTTVRIMGERFGLTGRSLAKADRDQALETLREGAREMVGQLFPARSAPAPLDPSAVLIAPSAPRVAPWLLAGAGLVATGVGLGFAIHGAGIRAQVTDSRDYSVEGAGRLDTASTFSTLATTFIIGGLITTGTGLALASMDL